ncbi:MAG TPA: response regulator transcription factor [Baekduia sp.]|nr:response regulator transcription factor [Baekduia sp.]HMJ32776.1 response regulator transcription factor [Baekduia sp.]
MSAHRLIVVEDDPELRSLVTRGLEEEGFAVTAVGDGASALAAARETVDALVVDVGLPDADGRDVCQALRAQGIGAPVLFLTARDAVTDRLAGFSAGGDDYLTKPFHFDELVARLKALLRRAGADPVTTVGALRLDPTTHAAANGEREVALTPTEFRVLAALAANPGVVLRRRDLVRAAWPEGAIVHDNTLDQYVARLRRKLRELELELGISTTHGVGYRLG